jgi:hypothetical protein
MVPHGAIAIAFGEISLARSIGSLASQLFVSKQWELERFSLLLLESLAPTTVAKTVGESCWS